MNGLNEYLRVRREHGGLGWASAQCRPVPRELWPPVLFHGGPADQTVLKMRAPSGDYRAIYASVGLDDPINYGQVRENGNPIGKDGIRSGRPGEVYIIVPHLLPRDTVIRRGSEYREWIIVSCSGQVAFHRRVDWRQIAELAAAGQKRFGHDAERDIEIEPLLGPFRLHARSAPPIARTIAAQMNMPVVYPSGATRPQTIVDYAQVVEKVTKDYICGVREKVSGQQIRKPNRLQEMACRAARQRGYNARQGELWRPSGESSR